jgi:hypothetical protein
MSIIPNGEFVKRVFNGVKLDELFVVNAYHPDDNTYESELLEETDGQTTVNEGFTVTTAVNLPRRTGKIVRLNAGSVEVVERIKY